MLDKYTQQLNKIDKIGKLEKFISKIPEYVKKENSTLNERMEFHKSELKKLKDQEKDTKRIGENLMSLAREKANILLFDNIKI